MLADDELSFGIHRMADPDRNPPLEPNDWAGELNIKESYRMASPFYFRYFRNLIFVQSGIAAKNSCHVFGGGYAESN